MTKPNYGKLTAGIVAAWFAFSLAASAMHLFKGEAGRLGLPVALAALTPILVFTLWFAISPAFRQFVLSRSPRVLTAAHAWRIGGFVFLISYTFGLLPGVFAFPAGLGDIAIGVTAPFVALKLANPDHRKGFIAWQLLGISDLVIAVTLGTTAALINPYGVPTDALTVLPLSLIPTFIVPLLLILHIICIAQARRWRRQPSSRAEKQFLPSEA